MKHMRWITMATLVFLFGLHAAASAQNVDSLVQALDSPDWTVRHDALDRLVGLDAIEWPPAFAQKVVELLDRAATAPEVEGSDGYGEYRMMLVDAVLALHGATRLDDARVMRGMAILGIQTGRSPKEYLAARGSASLPYLEEAWNSPQADRMAVVGTWALLLGPHRDRITRDERLDVMRRYLAGGGEEPIVFASTAGEFGFVVLIPIVEELARPAEYGAAGRSALRELYPLRAGASVPALAEGVADWLDGICVDPVGGKRGACESLVNLWATVQGQLGAGRTGPARNTLAAFARRATQAHEDGWLTVPEHRLLTGNAGYLLSQLR